MVKVLIFSDPGIDDSIAIIYALLNPKIDVVGIVTSYGNVSEAQATQNTAYLLKLANLKKIPIISGAKRPLTGETVVYYPEIHGPEGLGPIRPSKNLNVDVKPFDAIYSIINRYQDDLTILSIGRLTSLATGYIYDGDIMAKIKKIYMMGGAFLVPGNVTPTSEANFYGDPIACNIVLKYGKNVTIVPLNVTNYSIITPNIVTDITRQEYNPFTHLIKPIMTYYSQAYQKIVPGIIGAPVHDLLTISLLVNPNIGHFVTKQVEVNVLDFARGESIADFRPKPNFDPSKKTGNIFLEFDYHAFIQDFIQVMTGHLHE